MSSPFAQSYAEAIFDLELEKGNLEMTSEQLTLIVNSFKDNDEFIKILNHPQLGKDDKKQIIRDVYGNFDNIITNFLFVLVDNDRIGGLLDIYDAFIKIYNEYQNTINVLAYTTIALDNAQIDRLKEKLIIKYRHKIEVTNFIDEKVIGGMRLIINEDVIDYTINNQLKNLKSHVLKQI
ncbi:MAG: synthase subunit delta [Haloplasmataceae bacterium]|jgi:F-type H+-transporting ATPase subunit delta|nr:synthase subunit delta [Haloplasmataceae bacterium]